MKNFYNYQYFSGANVTIDFKKSNSRDDKQQVIECAGISFSAQNSQQPVYGYASTRFDVMLPGREIIQGNFLINFTNANYLLKKINKDASNSGSYNALLFEPFDIYVNFGKSSDNNNVVLRYCYIISRGQTVQISDQVILEEYSFIGRQLEYAQRR
tara:strand:+ start:354 stop:821 length:468 start_codon:yes stop_codon:yes gene_type:complete